MYSGFIAASDATGDAKYRDAMMAMGKQFDWKLRNHLPNADDQSVAQTYAELFLKEHDLAMIQPTKDEIEPLIAMKTLKPGDDRLPWWWCDALFMGPPMWARMYEATGDKRYITYLDEQWQKTSDLLYDKQEHLYFRDASYLSKTEANGKKMFWSRGNGWVMGGIVRTLEYLPKDDARRGFYVTQLQEMAARVKDLQGTDGLWHAGLLDPKDYPYRRFPDRRCLLMRLHGGSITMCWMRRSIGLSWRKPGRECFSTCTPTDDWDAFSRRVPSLHSMCPQRVTTMA